MVFEAETLSDSLESNWGLSGDRLGKTGTGVKRPVQFIPFLQVPSQHYTNAVHTVKTSPKVTEFNSEYFTREEDTFSITIIHNIEGNADALRKQGEADVEDIEEEIERIIKLSYNPQGGTGVFFTSDFKWRNEDDLQAEKPFMKRILDLRLTRIVPRKSTAFITYKRGVLLDVSESEGSSLPGSDYQYTEAFNIQARQGYRDFELPVTDQSQGPGSPWHYSGRFEGMITMMSYLKSTDLGSEGHKLNTIWQRLSNGEQPEVFLLRTYTNAAGETLTKSDKIIFLTYQESDPAADLLVVSLIGKIIKPGTWTVV